MPLVASVSDKDPVDLSGKLVLSSVARSEDTSAGTSATPDGSLNSAAATAGNSVSPSSDDDKSASSSVAETTKAEGTSTLWCDVHSARLASTCACSSHEDQPRDNADLSVASAEVADTEISLTTATALEVFLVADAPELPQDEIDQSSTLAAISSVTSRGDETSSSARAWSADTSASLHTSAAGADKPGDCNGVSALAASGWA